MNQIKPYALWLGHSGDHRDFRPVLDLGVQALVELALEEPPAHPPRELIYCRLPLLDGVGNEEGLLHLAISTVTARSAAAGAARNATRRSRSETPAMAVPRGMLP